MSAESYMTPSNVFIGQGVANVSTANVYNSFRNPGIHSCGPPPIRTFPGGQTVTVRSQVPNSYAKTVSNIPYQSHTVPSNGTQNGTLPRNGISGMQEPQFPTFSKMVNQLLPAVDTFSSPHQKSAENGQKRNLTSQRSPGVFATSLEAVSKISQHLIQRVLNIFNNFRPYSDIWQ